jgi:flagellar hook-associated protein FlgK
MAEDQKRIEEENEAMDARDSKQRTLSELLNSKVDNVRQGESRTIVIFD